VTKDYQVVRGKAGDIQVKLWYVHGMEDVKKQLLDAAVSGMKYFSSHFGKYPYKEIDVVLGETGYGIAGMEYPGLVTSVGKVPSQKGIVPAVNVVVHELAHQWWYGVVGNNQVKEPWLDEGLTTFSEFLYMQDKMKQDERVFLKRAAEKTDEIYQKTGLTSGESLYKYPDEIYGLMVYIRPTAMMYNLIEQIDKEKVLRILNQYYHKYQFQVATGKNFIEVANEVSGEDLTPFFNKWIYFK
jgi:aminopeptidase N